MRPETDRICLGPTSCDVSPRCYDPGLFILALTAFVHCENLWAAWMSSHTLGFKLLHSCSYFRLRLSPEIIFFEIVVLVTCSDDKVEYFCFLFYPVTIFVLLYHDWYVVRTLTPPTTTLHWVPCMLTASRYELSRAKSGMNHSEFVVYCTYFVSLGTC